jgi:hypothetical protein
MMQRYQSLKTIHEKKEASSLYFYLQRLYKFDEWVREEHQGGFNYHIMPEDGIEEVLKLGEASMQASG